MLYKPIAARPAAALPPFMSYGWREMADTGWEYHMPDGDYYPTVGSSRQLDRTLPKPRPHYFLIRTVRLDVLGAADYRLDAFIRAATAYR